MNVALIGRKSKFGSPVFVVFLQKNGFPNDLSYGPLVFRRQFVQKARRYFREHYCVSWFWFFVLRIRHLKFPFLPPISEFCHG
jgi:hypothetical protein